MTRPAAQYLRVSSARQAATLDGQAQEVAAFAALHDYEIVRTYADVGRSGLTLKGRPGLKRLLADVLGGAPGFAAVLVQDVSRWGRFQDADEAAHYEFLCRQAKVEVRYASEGFPVLEGRGAGLFKAVKRLMAAEFSRELSAKTRRAAFHRAAEGFWVGGRPGYGLRRATLGADGAILRVMEAGERKALQGQRVVLVPGPPHQVAIVRRIFQLHLRDRLGFSAIAARLNREGIPAEGGGAWDGQAIGDLVRSPKYAGDALFGRCRRELGGQVRPMPPATWLRVEGVAAPIVSRRWVAAARARQRAVRRGLSSPEILRRVRELWRRQGPLSWAQVTTARGLPGPQTVRHRLGAWPRIHARLGYYPPRPTGAPGHILPGYIDLCAPTGDKAGRRGPSAMSNARFALFLEDRLVAAGDLPTVALAAHAAQTPAGPMPLVLDDATGGVIDLDLRGDAEAVLARLPTVIPAALPSDEPSSPRPGRGRPKLGVTAREVTLLPRHWTWLANQPGGASAALRRLVEAAARASRDPDARRAAQTATYKAMYALAGHQPGYEAALRALYGETPDAFSAALNAWPKDVAAYVRRLAAPVWSPDAAAV